MILILIHMLYVCNEKHTNLFFKLVNINQKVTGANDGTCALKNRIACGSPAEPLVDLPLAVEEQSWGAKRSLRYTTN